MSDDLLYKLHIAIENGADIDDIESRLQELLTELYREDQVESVTVSNKTPPIDEDMEELLEVIDNVENDNIRQSIEFVLALEKLD